MRHYESMRKFIVDVVDSDKPLIYITQVGQPRIVLFGKDLSIERPATLTLGPDRFMVKADGRPFRDRGVLPGPGSHAQESFCEPSLIARFVQFLGHTTTVDSPSNGLGLTYGETVGSHADLESEIHQG